MSMGKTAIITGASQGIGAEVVRLFMDRGYDVVATALHITRAGGFENSRHLQLVEGDIGELETAQKITETAMNHFGSIDVLVNNAGIFVVKPFTEYTQEDLRRLIKTNVEGFVYTTQLCVRQMLEQKTKGSIVSITASLADHPNRASKASVSMITKGGLNSITRHLAMEYSQEGIRVNAVAPGVVRTPLHPSISDEEIKTLSPMGMITDPKEIARAVLYLAESPTLTGEVLLVDGGAHLGKW
jgi:NAD(P)-dependent dehydrogenase (short-subunit alcohol dehydrogenase family)